MVLLLVACWLFLELFNSVLLFCYWGLRLSEDSEDLVASVSEITPVTNSGKSSLNRDFMQSIYFNLLFFVIILFIFSSS